MNWKELRKTHFPHFLSISIERFVSRKTRDFFRRVSAFAALTSFALSFGVSPVYFGKADAMFFLFADIYLLFFFAEVFYRSMSNEGIKTRVNESIVGESLRLDHALSLILYDTDEIDVSRVFFETDIGGKIFENLNIPEERRQEFVYRNRIPIIASSLEIDPENVDLPKYTGAVYEADKELRTFLSENSKSKEDFVSAAQKVSLSWEEERRRERFWGRENLGAIPSIGSMLLLGSTRGSINSKFVSKMPISDLAFNSLVSDEGVALIEEALERFAWANVLIVSDDPTLPFDCLKKLARKIELGSSLPSLEHRPLRRFEWKEFLDETQKVGWQKEAIEKTIQKIFREAGESGSMLYIADLPGLISSSKAVGLNLPVFLLPHLSSDKLQIIASSSVADYRFFLETNPSLNQKFVKIEIS